MSFRNLLTFEQRTPRLRNRFPDESLTSLDPVWAWSTYDDAKDRAWTSQHAAHLLRRAGFGSTPAEVTEAVDAGHATAVEHALCGRESSEFEAEFATLESAIAPRRDVEANVALWLRRMLLTPHQLLEKATLFWHGHFATSGAKVTKPSLLLDQNRLLRQHALQRLEPLVQQISRDPAMLIYLDSTDNRKTHPNENYAREVMELFCLGVGNYTEQDIQEVARCFTGWEVRREKFRINTHQHDKGPKTVLGVTDDFDGDDAIRIILEQDAAPQFIAKKLIRFFMRDFATIPKTLLAPLAANLRETDFDIQAALRKIFTSNWFYSDWCLGQKVRSPLELAIGTLRTLNASTNLYELANRLNEMGQKPLFPPNVKGWDGGRDWINSSTMLSRQNLTYRIAMGQGVKFQDDNLLGWLERHDIRGGSDVVDFLISTLVAIPVSDNVRAELIGLANKHSNDRLKQAQKTLAAIEALPEFHVA